MDLDVQDDNETSNLDIKEKYAKIEDLQHNLARAQFFISFLEQENKQLRDK